MAAEETTATLPTETFCDWCGHNRPESPCARCQRRYESARAVVADREANGSTSEPTS